MKDVILQTRDLSVGYKEKAVVEQILLSVEPGQILTLIGPNGAGKSTLLKTLTRQLLPLSGDISLSGRILSDYTHRDLAQRSAAVFTASPHPELMQCRDVVSAGRYPYTGRLGQLTATDRAVVAEVMELVGISEIAEEDFNCISDGQRQRVLLARALCQEPELLILDEPTSFLDIRNKLEFLHLLKSLVRKKHLAVIMSLHELDLAQKFSDCVLCLKNHRVDRVGTPEEIFRGDYIQTLYDVHHGSYNTLYGTAEPEPCKETPRVFVISGGGSGIPIFRQLQRKGIPFAAGVLHEGDLDEPAAKALASQVILERAYEPISPEQLASATKLMLRCESVLCPLELFGAMNRANLELKQIAEDSGKLKVPEDVLQ